LLAEPHATMLVVELFLGYTAELLQLAHAVAAGAAHTQLDGHCMLRGTMRMQLYSMPVLPVLR